MKVKRITRVLVAAVLMLCLTIPASAIGPKHGGPMAALPTASSLTALSEETLLAEPSALSSFTYTLPDSSIYSDASADELWTQFAQAEAYKKLYELQEHALKEQLKLLEGPGAYYYYYSGGDGTTAYAQLMELKNQEYQIKLQKEQYEWQKKQVESYLKLTGAKMDKAQLEYALYSGAIATSGLGYEDLYTQRSSLQLQEQQLEWQKKSLEYQYQLGQLSDSEFVTQYASIFQQKESAKTQREKLDVEIQLLFGSYGPGIGIGPALLP